MIVAKPGFKMSFARDDIRYYLAISKTTDLIHIRKMDDYKMDFICGLDGDLSGPQLGRRDGYVTCPDCAKRYLALEGV